jgi:hypothetical protein
VLTNGRPAATRNTRDELEAAGVSSSSGGKKRDEGPTTVRYVDMSKTAEAADKVRVWQETGKKRYP